MSARAEPIHIDFTDPNNYRYDPPEKKDDLIPIIQHLHKEILQNPQWEETLLKVDSRLLLLLQKLPPRLKDGYFTVDVVPRSKLEDPFCKFDSLSYRIPITIQSNGTTKILSIFGHFEPTTRT